MIKIVSLFLLIPFVAMTQCDWSTVRTQNGGFLYSNECHVAIGNLVLKYEIAEQQIVEYEALVTAQDKKIQVLTESRDMWKKATENAWGKYDVAKWIYFGAGVLSTSAIIYVVNKSK